MLNLSRSLTQVAAGRQVLSAGVVMVAVVLVVVLVSVVVPMPAAV